LKSFNWQRWSIHFLASLRTNCTEVREELVGKMDFGFQIECSVRLTSNMGTRIG